MNIHYVIPDHDEIRAIEYRARQMRAATVAAGFRAIVRGLRGLGGRIAAFGARSARS